MNVDMRVIDVLSDPEIQLLIWLAQMLVIKFVKMFLQRIYIVKSLSWNSGLWISKYSYHNFKGPNTTFFFVALICINTLKCIIFLCMQSPGLGYCEFGCSRKIKGPGRNAQNIFSKALLMNLISPYNLDFKLGCR